MFNIIFTVCILVKGQIGCSEVTVPVEALNPPACIGMTDKVVSDTLERLKRNRAVLASAPRCVLRSDG